MTRMPSDATLTKTERNKVFGVVEKSGLSPLDFSWSEVEERQALHRDVAVTVSRLTHGPTSYFFQFGLNYVEFCPGAIKKQEFNRHEDFWPNKQAVLKEWLIRVREEIEAPDLWAAISNSRSL